MRILFYIYAAMVLMALAIWALDPVTGHGYNGMASTLVSMFIGLPWWYLAAQISTKLRGDSFITSTVWAGMAINLAILWWFAFRKPHQTNRRD